MSKSLSLGLLPYSPVLVSAFSNTSAPDTANAASWTSLVAARTDLQPQVISVFRGNSSLTMALEEDVTETILGAWNSAFSALFVGGSLILGALILHFGTYPWSPLPKYQPLLDRSPLHEFRLTLPLIGP